MWSCDGQTIRQQPHESNHPSQPFHAKTSGIAVMYCNSHNTAEEVNSKTVLLTASVKKLKLNLVAFYSAFQPYHQTVLQNKMFESFIATVAL